jgi:hypothetical protein
MFNVCDLYIFHGDYLGDDSEAEVDHCRVDLIIQIIHCFLYFFGAKFLHIRPQIGVLVFLKEFLNL